MAMDVPQKYLGREALIEFALSDPNATTDPGEWLALGAARGKEWGSSVFFLGRPAFEELREGARVVLSRVGLDFLFHEQKSGSDLRARGEVQQIHDLASTEERLDRFLSGFDFGRFLRYGADQRF